MGARLGVRKELSLEIVDNDDHSAAPSAAPARVGLEGDAIVDFELDPLIPFGQPLIVQASVGIPPTDPAQMPVLYHDDPVLGMRPVQLNPISYNRDDLCTAAHMVVETTQPAEVVQRGRGAVRADHDLNRAACERRLAFGHAAMASSITPSVAVQDPDVDRNVHRGCAACYSARGELRRPVHEGGNLLRADDGHERRARPGPYGRHQDELGVSSRGRGVRVEVHNNLYEPKFSRRSGLSIPDSPGEIWLDSFQVDPAIKHPHASGRRRSRIMDGHGRRIHRPRRGGSPAAPIGRARIVRARC